MIKLIQRLEDFDLDNVKIFPVSKNILLTVKKI